MVLWLWINGAPNFHLLELGLFCYVDSRMITALGCYASMGTGPSVNLDQLILVLHVSHFHHRETWKTSFWTSLEWLVAWIQDSLHAVVWHFSSNQARFGQSKSGNWWRPTIVNLLEYTDWCRCTCIPMHRGIHVNCKLHAQEYMHTCSHEVHIHYWLLLVKHELKSCSVCG